MEELSRRSDRIVVMARKGSEILREVYRVPEGKVDVIPHGIPDMPFVDSSVYKRNWESRVAWCCSRSGSSGRAKA